MAPHPGLGLCAVLALGACGRTPVHTGQWGSRELAIVVEHPPEEHGGHERIALVRPDTLEFAWTPLDEVYWGRWLSEGPALFVISEGQGSAWRYGDSDELAVPSSEGIFLYDFTVSPQGRYVSLVEAASGTNLGHLRVLDGRRGFAELGRWSGCFHDVPLGWIDDGPGVLLAEADCDLPAREGPFGVVRVGDGATQMLLELDEAPIVSHPSPNGRWMAAAYDEHGMILDLRTGATLLEEGAPGLPRFKWNRDSTRFAFRGETESIVYDSSMVEITRFTTDGGQPQFSYVDERVASVNGQAVVVYDPAMDELQSFDAPVPGGLSMWFVGDHRIHYEPDSEFSRRMAYVLDPDTGSWTELLALGPFRFEGYWSPDGATLLAFEGCDEDTKRPVLFDEDLWRRADGPCHDYWNGVWSPDSDVIALQVGEDDEVLLMRADGETRSLGRGDVVGWRP